MRRPGTQGPRFRGESVHVLAAVGGRHERSSTSPPRIDAQDGGCHDATLTHQGSRGEPCSDRRQNRR